MFVIADTCWGQKYIQRETYVKQWSNNSHVDTEWASLCSYFRVQLNDILRQRDNVLEYGAEDVPACFIIDYRLCKHHCHRPEVFQDAQAGCAFSLLVRQVITPDV